MHLRKLPFSIDVKAMPLSVTRFESCISETSWKGTRIWNKNTHWQFCGTLRMAVKQQNMALFYGKIWLSPNLRCQEHLQYSRFQYSHIACCRKRWLRLHSNLFQVRGKTNCMTGYMTRRFIFFILALFRYEIRSNSKTSSSLI